MASIHPKHRTPKTTRPAGEKPYAWIVRWVEPDGHRGRTFHSEAEAKAYKTHIEYRQTTGTHIPTSAANTPLETVGQTWLDARRNLQPVTRTHYVQQINAMAAWWHGRGIGQIRPTDVDAYVTHLLDEGRSPKTIRKYLNVLSSIYDEVAVRDGLALTNPARGVRLPRQPRREMLWLTPAEVDRLAEAAGAWGLLIEFLAWTGLRWGEMERLTVGDVDQLRRRVRVSRAKTEAGVRWVPLERGLFPKVVELCGGRGPGERLFLTPERVWVQTFRGGTTAVQRRKGGRRLNPSNFREDVWLPAKRLAGIDPRLRVHDLRHTCATWLISQGLSDVEVAGWLGHANANITRAVYAHLFDHELSGASEALSSLRGSKVTGPATIAKVEEL